MQFPPLNQKWTIVALISAGGLCALSAAAHFTAQTAANLEAPRSTIRPSKNFWKESATPIRGSGRQVLGL
jgi:hypothetical protein